MKTQPGLVSVIIINFSSGAHIERCIGAIKTQTYPEIEILVIDNGSTDGALALVQQMASEGRLRLFAGKNVGFAKANNLGICESSGEFVLVLNADAFPRPDYIEKCVAAFCNDRVGTVIGKLVSASDTSIIDSAGIYFYREGVSIDRGFGEKDRGQYDKQEFVDGACGAAVMYSRAMLEDIRIGEEFYDEHFFAFVEDVELSFRASTRGWKTLYIPEAVTLHVRGGSSQTLSEYVYFLNERNTRLFLRTSFASVARTSDILLQRVLLFLRSVAMLWRLSPSYRKRLRRELVEIGSDISDRRSLMSLPERPSVFVMNGRRSYLLETVARRIGIASSGGIVFPQRNP